VFVVVVMLVFSSWLTSYYLEYEKDEEKEK
jgi:hypothetical protein